VCCIHRCLSVCSETYLMPPYCCTPTGRKTMVFRDVTPWNLVDGYQRFEGHLYHWGGIGTYLPYYMASCPKWPLWELQNSDVTYFAKITWNGHLHPAPVMSVGPFVLHFVRGSSWAVTDCCCTRFVLEPHDVHNIQNSRNPVPCRVCIWLTHPCCSRLHRVTG
jgi:hypothetical protein